MLATSRAAALALVVSGVCACNLLVGGDDLVFRNDGGAGPSDGGGGVFGGGGGGVGAGIANGGSGGDGAGGGLVATPVKQIATGGFTCALLESGKVRCWGANDSGQLGIGSIAESLAPQEDVSLGDVVVDEVVVGRAHACARSGGDVYCWGADVQGSVGYPGPSPENVGDDELVSSVGPVAVGGAAFQLAAGSGHTCAVLGGGRLRCWGSGANGRLGYGKVNAVGDTETPDAAGDVPLGGRNVIRVSAGGAHTCAAFGDGALACWGMGTAGQLGYGNTSPIGDTPWTVTPLDTGAVAAAASDVAAGGAHSCALFDEGELRCWGAAYANGYDEPFGALETASEAPDLGLPWSAARVSAGDKHTCAVSTTGLLQCWGKGTDGRLGYGGTTDRIVFGNDDLVVSEAGVAVRQVAAGERHTCALLVNGAVRCWGYGGDGRLGYGNTDNVQSATSAGDVPFD